MDGLVVVLVLVRLAAARTVDGRDAGGSKGGGALARAAAAAVDGTPPVPARIGH